jgi:hypothetical protein
VSRFIYCYAECRCAECRYAECRGACRNIATATLSLKKNINGQKNIERTLLKNFVESCAKKFLGAATFGRKQYYLKTVCQHTV